MQQSLAGQLSLLQQQLQQLPRCMQPHKHQPRMCVARYQSRDLEQLFEQAREAPRVTRPLPVEHTAAPQQQERQQQQQPVSHDAPAAAGSTFNPSAYSLPQAQQQQQQQRMGELRTHRLRPSKMDFATMYAQLQAWQQRFMTAHVPRHCFDAPELGAWVRYNRKQHKEGRLEQWKVDSLNVLGFEWELSDHDAKWHNMYHQLRRHRHLYGSTDIDGTASTQDGCDWRLVAGWLHRQARLLAKQKLSSQKRAMLQQLGVRLTVPKRLLQRTAQLQALNGTERRQLRKKWKLQDNMQLLAQKQQRQQELQELLQQRQQQRQLEQRRHQLLQQAAATAAAAAADVDAGGAGDGSSHAAPSSAAPGHRLVSVALQQLQDVQQLSQQQVQQLSQQQPDMQPAQEQGPSLSQTCARTDHQQQVAQAQPRQQQQALQHPCETAAEPPVADSPGSAAADPGLTHSQQPMAVPQLQGVGHASWKQPAASEHLQRQRQQLHEQSLQQQQQQEGDEQQRQETTQSGQELQQQQQQQRTTWAVDALLFQPNRRRKKVGHKSRQERWMASSADS